MKDLKRLKLTKDGQQEKAMTFGICKANEETVTDKTNTEYYTKNTLQQ